MYARLKKIVSTRFEVSEQQITPSSSCRALGLDALDLVELSLAIERELGVQVTDDELADAETLERIATLLICREAAVL